MKSIVSALIALSFFASVVAPEAAYSSSVWEQLDRDGRGEHAM